MAYPPEKSSPDSSTTHGGNGLPTVSFKPTPVSSPGSGQLDAITIIGIVFIAIAILFDVAFLMGWIR